MTSFNQLNLSEETLKSISAMGFKKPTEIQCKAIPLLLQWKDLIALADTGTGKTAAYAIPAIENLDKTLNKVQVLILAPTRELACQIADQFKQLSGKASDEYGCVAIYGGQKMKAQLDALKKYPRIIVGTPGRLLDHIRQGSLNLKSVQTVVLDEADKMLEMGFSSDIEMILSLAERRKQTSLFSATMQNDILQLAAKYQNKAQRINLLQKEQEKLGIEQIYYHVAEAKKLDLIKRIIAVHRLRSNLIFCNTRSQVDKLYSSLKAEGFSVANLHGGLDQRKRDAVMRKFREGEARILIATDVAARGIDVDDIEAVFNFNLPRDSEDYIHRIGRTGRAGKSGLAFSLVTPREEKHLKSIATKHKLSIKEKAIPSIHALEISSLIALESLLMDGVLLKKAYSKHLKTIKNLQKEVKTPEKILKIFMDELLKKKDHFLGAGLGN